jgi:putative component of membrane protein insertase Oxa1/YidC/SpoIIIJ protein YidD
LARPSPPWSDDRDHHRIETVGHGERMGPVAWVLSPPSGWRLLGQHLPLLPFHPSCSECALEALERHGAGRSWLAVRRVSRCHPWHEGGLDHPDPNVRSQRQLQSARPVKAPHV